jgi:hypothetical protein
MHLIFHFQRGVGKRALIFVYGVNHCFKLVYTASIVALHLCFLKLLELEDNNP